MDTSEHDDNNSAHIPAEILRQNKYVCDPLENFLLHAAMD